MDCGGHNSTPHNWNGCLTGFPLGDQTIRRSMSRGKRWISGSSMRRFSNSGMARVSHLCAEKADALNGRAFLILSDAFRAS